jgi:hypothetical protein
VLTGRRFKLKTPTIALDLVDGKRRAITVPAGTVIKVVRGPAADGGKLIDVVWDGHPIIMFACDVSTRGVELQDAASDYPDRRRRAEG